MAGYLGVSNAADPATRSPCRNPAMESLPIQVQAAAINPSGVNGEIVGGSSNLAADFIKMKGKSLEIDSHIGVLDITSSTAVVRVVVEKDAIGADSIGHLTLTKIDRGWTVVAMVFHEFSN